MNSVVLLAACFALASAGIPDGYNSGHYAFHGRYEDKCGNDGFYYRDHASFVICSNGNAYEQPCAPGSRNSAYDHYHHGNHYYYRDFCDVNLVDYGAGIPHGYGHHADGYGHEDGHHANGYGYDDRHHGDGYGYEERRHGDDYGYGDRHDDAYGYDRKY